jgi:low temperature requirement protein LtrA
VQVKGTQNGMSHGEPLIKPPALRTGKPGSASRLELFFDLAYVLVVLELATTFLHDLSWHGLGTFVTLYVALWFSWVGYTLYANRFDTDDVVFRIAKLAATLAIAGCAASASSATSSFSTPFAACFLLGRIILLLLLARAWRHVPEARPTITVYLGSTGVSGALWAVSMGTAGTVRLLLWIAAVATDAAGPVLATRREDRAPLHMEHLPERFGLLVILVLGEAVGGAATGVHDAGWAAPSITLGITGFVIAAALWWNYFDITAEHSEQELHDGEDTDPAGGGAATDERHDLFVYGHLPLTAGIVIAGVGIEDLVLHPDAPLPSAGGWTLACGLMLYLVGTALILGGTRRTWRAIWPWPSLALPIIAVAPLPRHDTPMLLVGALAAVTVSLAIVGTTHRGSRQITSSS